MFGDPVGTKQDHHTRLALLNINMFHTSLVDNNKAQALNAWMQQYEVDGLSGVEPGVRWDNMPHGYKLNDLLRSDTVFRTVAAYNKTGRNIGLRRQYGGTFMVIRGELTSRIAGMGMDSSGLGRWCWTLFKGKDNVRTRLITVYRPVKQDASHPFSTYMQHLRHLRRSGRTNEDPRDAILKDLREQLKAWRSDGERLVVLGDLNGDTTKGKIATFFDELGMTEATLARHPELPIPASVCRDEREGRLKVDGIWVTAEIPVDAASWLTVEQCPGDHRAGILDINTVALLGESLQKIVRPQARRLNCQIPSAKQQYQELLDLHFRRHRLEEKLYQFGDDVKHARLSPTEQQRQAEALDKIRTEGMRYAEKRCRKLRMGNVAYNPETAISFKRKRLWRMVIRAKEGKGVVKQHIRRLAKACKVHKCMSNTLEQAKDSLATAEKNHRKLKVPSTMSRESWIFLKTQDPNIKPKVAKILKRQLATERKRSAYRRIRQLEGVPIGRSVSQVEIPGTDEDGNPTVVLCETEETVVQGIQTHLRERFALAHDTPTLQEPLVSELGMLGNTQAAKEILAGTYVIPDGVDGDTRDFIMALMKTAAETQQSSRLITVDDYIDYWSHVLEKTSSSYSGFHFGHYKAAAGSRFLANIHALFTQIIFSSGESLQRWQRGLQAILEKTSGVITVDKLRAILLMEADFNFGNKILIGKRMMDVAHATDQIPDEIYSTRGNQASLMSLSRRLLMDLTRMKRVILVVTSVDAHTCYDRIAHSVASIACQRLDVNPSVVITMFNTIQKMKFFLRTAYGDSSQSYGGSTEQKIFQGVCQGNGAGPAVWIAMLLCLIRFMYRRRHESHIRSALSNVLITLLGFIFVDDTDLVYVAPSHKTTPTQAVAALQAAVSSWHGALRASGGALKPAKCAWSILAYQHKNGKWQLHSKSSFPATLQAPDEQGNLVDLQRLETHESVKVVGVEQALDGNMDGQLEALKKQCDDWAISIRKGYITRQDAWLFLQTKLWPSLRYPLLSTTFTKAQGITIMSKLLSALLPRLGANAYFPAAYRFATHTHQGFALPSVWNYRGIEQVLTLLSMGAGKTQCGKLLRANLEQVQLGLGIGRLFLNTNYKTYSPWLKFSPIDKHYWVVAMWEFISEAGWTIGGYDINGPPLQREGDEFIMEWLFRNAQPYAKSDPAAWNRVRISLQAVHLSDITTGDGCLIRTESRRGKPTAGSNSKLDWPREIPSKKDRDLWTAALQRATSDDFELRSTLGDWISQPHREWKWWYHPDTDTLYEGTFHNSWRKSEAGLLPQPWYKPTGICGSLPGDCVRTTVGPNSSYARASHTGGCKDSILMGPQPEPTSITKLIETWGEEAWILKYSNFTHSAAVAAAITNGTALSCSDGSYKVMGSEDLATAAWKMEDSAHPGGPCCAGVLQCSGTEIEVNNYRGEYHGIHAQLAAVLAICKFHGVTSGAITIGCDLKNGIWKASHRASYVANRMKHGDLIRAIRCIRDELHPIQITFKHVLGHQDDTLDYYQLDRLSQLNVDVDELAQSFLDELILTTPKPVAPYCIKGEGWRCIANGKKYTGNGPRPLEDALGRQLMRQWLNKKRQLEEEAFDFVDWEAMAAAMKAFPVMYQLFVTKMVSGHCAVGKMMHKWRFWTKPNCPLCNHECETVWHMLTCPDERSRDIFEDSLEAFEEWLTKSETLPPITQCFISTLRAGPTAKFEDHAAEPVRMAAMYQDFIGSATYEEWSGQTNFFFGRISDEWRNLQAAHYRQLRSQRTSAKWAAGVITQLLKMCHDLWTGRNGVVHERNASGILLNEAEQMDAYFKTQYERGDAELLEDDKHLLSSHTLHYWLFECKFPAEKRLWIESMELARELGEAHLAQLETDISRQSRALRDWLIPIPATATTTTTATATTPAAATATTEATITTTVDPTATIPAAATAPTEATITTTVDPSQQHSVRISMPPANCSLAGP